MIPSLQNASTDNELYSTFTGARSGRVFIYLCEGERICSPPLITLTAAFREGHNEIYNAVPLSFERSLIQFQFDRIRFVFPTFTYEQAMPRMQVQVGVTVCFATRAITFHLTA